MEGRVSSVQSMGAVDGPGLRYVVFLQGCRWRCRYCHNPDTWPLDAGTEWTAEALAATVVRPLLPRRRPDGSAWDLVDAYTGEVLRAGVDRPHTRETDGRPAETSTAVRRTVEGEPSPNSPYPLAVPHAYTVPSSDTAMAC